MIKLKSILTEGFNQSEEADILNVVQKCFSEKGNKGVRDYDILNKYLGKLKFEVDAADIEIGGWKSNSYNRQIKYAYVLLQGKKIGLIQAYAA